MLNQFEFVGEAPAEVELVNSASVVGADLLNDKALVVLVERDALDQTVYLLAFRVEIKTAFFVEEGLLPTSCSIGEFLGKHYELGRPWRRHIEVLLVFNLIVFRAGVGVAFFLFIVVALVSSYHDILPLASLVLVELHTETLDLARRVEVDPEVLVVENGLN